MSAETASTSSSSDSRLDTAAAPATLAALAEAQGVDFPLHTPRLSLSLLASSDADGLWSYWQLPETSEWTSSRPASAKELMSERLAAGNTLAVRRRGEAGSEPTSAPVLGEVLVKLQDAWSHPEVAHLARGAQAEIGYAFHPDATGHGFAYEAVTAVLDLIVDLGIRRIEAFCMAGNTASWRLLDRLGLRREGTYIAESLHRDRGWVDAYSYAILAAEWQAERS
ncbi:GNAT family N-acetyltransferase [Brevibacterium gallinarum]|uniref:GNAT family N-acetyltransferase n=1 Tax=Brevibacterium gallinarum TaxID=2762220 RepID=A0ABR8WVU0_9MICO|nr:GNAT family N-acetyltransferase [Brevibacterium gallinarum]MBD8021211.1 GNAT family N-acetyltransferase [Brevibacterium gallinarum]